MMMANATANESPVKNLSTHNVSDPLGAVHDNFMDASRPQIIGGVTIAYQMMTTNGKTGPTRGKWDSAKGKDSEVTAKPRQS